MGRLGDSEANGFGCGALKLSKHLRLEKFAARQFYRYCHCLILPLLPTDRDFCYFHPIVLPKHQPMPILETIFVTIAKEILKGAVKDKWKSQQREHRALAILKPLGLARLENEPKSIYAHALVDYGVDKEPPQLVLLFAQADVRAALEKTPEKLPATLDAHLHTNPDLKALKGFPSVKSLEEEIAQFQSIFEGFQRQAADPFMLKRINSMQDTLEKLEEENRINSFEYQVEKYLNLSIRDFAKNYFSRSQYVPLNGVKNNSTFSIDHSDDLTLVKGVGSRVAEMLKANGILTFADMASTSIDRYREILKQNSVSKFRDPSNWSQDALMIKSSDEIPSFGSRKNQEEFRPLDNYIEKWLNKTSSKLLIIMGEYGTGKTTFTKFITHQLACNYLNRDYYTLSIKDEKRRIPLYLPLRDFEKSMENFVSDKCSNGYNIKSLNFAGFKQRIDQDELLVIFDGFDEMTQKTDADEKERNFAKIRRLLLESSNSKFILTCREEYFQSREEMQKIFGQDVNTDIVHLLPFDDNQIHQFLRSHTDDPEGMWQQIENTFDLKDLAKRPVLLELIINHLPSLLKEKGKNGRIKASDLYRSCMKDEFKRKYDLSFLTRDDDRLEILKRLAVWMYVNDTLSFDTREIGGELKLQELFEVKATWEYEKRLSEFLTFTFLLREDDYRFRISHKSFRDYLTALVFVDEVNNNALLHFPKAMATQEIRNFMLEHPLDKKILLQWVLTAKQLPTEKAWQGTNAANLLLKLDKQILAGENLSDCILKEVDFSESNLSETSFHGAVLEGSAFSESILLAASIAKADFSDCSLDLTDTGLKSLVGIEKLFGLKALYCSSNPISDLSPLAGLPNLHTLSCDYNEISDLSPLADLPNLQTLYCDYNEISDLSPVTGLQNLQMLSCSSNQIGDLSPLADFQNLQRIDCHSNKISDLSPLASLHKLQFLYCHSNLIIDLSPLAGLHNLHTLYCHSNLISDLMPLAGLQNLQTLSCSSNPISDLSPLAGLPNLQTLYCDPNQISKKGIDMLKEELPNLRFG